MISLLLLAACADNPADLATPATIKEPVEAPPTPEGPIGKASEVDLTNSRIAFVGSKVTGSHDGHFNTFEGRVFVDGGVVTATEFTIDTGSVWADADDLTSHLKDEDFFFVEKFPTATFNSTSIAGGQVTGVLDFRGVQKELSFPATLETTDTGTTLKAEFSMNRKDWGVMYAGKADNLIDDLVLIKLDLVFPAG